MIDSPINVVTACCGDLLGVPITGRMPVMLHARDVERWLDPSVKDAEDITPLLRPYPAEEMAAHPVSRRVNKPENEGPELIEVDESVRELWQ
jgi:putative SOS response-associated peptidase YedK